MSRTTVFNITDLRDLEHISRKTMDFITPDSSYTLRVLERGIARLNITLRWPLQAFRDFEKSPAAVSGCQEQEEQDSPISEAWTETGEILRNMETLTRLRLWFDHSEPSTWALVNEKALLDPLIAKMSKTVTVWAMPNR